MPLGIEERVVAGSDPRSEAEPRQRTRHGSAEWGRSLPPSYLLHGQFGKGDAAKRLFSTSLVVEWPYP